MVDIRFFSQFFSFKHSSNKIFIMTPLELVKNNNFKVSRLNCQLKSNNPSKFKSCDLFGVFPIFEITRVQIDLTWTVNKNWTFNSHVIVLIIEIFHFCHLTILNVFGNMSKSVSNMLQNVENCLTTFWSIQNRENMSEM